MIAALAIVFGLAFMAPGLHRLLRGATGWVLGAAVAALTSYFATFLPAVAAGGAVAFSQPWVPSLGIDLSFRIDGLSLVFLLLIGGIGALILVYSGAYFHGRPQPGRFYALLLLFMGAMLGLVASDNLIAMFLFWELTSLASYLLIGFDHEKAESRAAALQALLVTGAGGLALLAGFLLIGQVGGSFSFSELLAKSDLIREHGLYLPILLLILTGAFTKSAQVPFHFWLPNAMSAPTPVSAYLHSATMVKAGIFLLARMFPLIGGTEAWHYIVTLVGVATMLTGALMALPQTDLKRVLAFSTVSALGTLTLLLGLGTVEAMKAAAVFLVVHSLYKGALFMVAGAVDHETGTRDVRLLSGLIRCMPITAVAAGIAALSMSGFPPLLGFISKELLYEAKLQAPSAAAFITAAGICANVAMVAVSIIVGIRPFYGQVRVPAGKPHEPPAALWLGPVVLAALSAVAGLLPGLVEKPIIAPVAAAMRGEAVVVNLALWHGVNVVLLLSVLTVLAGVGLWLARSRVRSLADRLAPLARLGPERGYEFGLAALKLTAARLTRLLQHGYLRYYVLTLLGVAVVLAGYASHRFGVAPPIGVGLGDVHFHEVAVGAFILGAALVAVMARSRLAAVAALGGVGYGVALVYAMFGAPDLAITQILVETLTLVLFVLVVLHLPRFTVYSRPRRRALDALVAAGGGVVITGLVYKAIHVQVSEPISSYFLENAPRAQGRNVVNVILVDFRALDTLGEITVLALAALGVFALMKLRPAQKKDEVK